MAGIVQPARTHPRVRLYRCGNITTTDETSELWAAAKERQAEAGGDHSDKSASGNITGSASGDSRDVAGASVGVSGSSIDKAVKILAEAPDIAAAVSSGGWIRRPTIQLRTQTRLEVNIDFQRQKEVKWWSRSLQSPLSGRTDAAAGGVEITATCVEIFQVLKMRT